MARKIKDDTPKGGWQTPSTEKSMPDFGKYIVDAPAHERPTLGVGKKFNKRTQQWVFE